MILYNAILKMKKISLIPIFLYSSLFLFSQEKESVDISDPKGAIIIAQIEGDVTVLNNTTGEPLPADRVKSGGLLFDGHTVKTGANAKVVLLLSNGTVSTLKSESVLNIKKFTQAKFDPGTAKLSELEGEPSSYRCSHRPQHW